MFLAAQQAWVEGHLPTNGEMLETTQWGGGKLPAKAQPRRWPTTRTKQDAQKTAASNWSNFNFTP